MKCWKKTTLGTLVKNGSASYQTGPFGTALKASEYSPDGVPLISVGEIRAGYLQIHSNTPRVDKDVLERLPKYILRKDDIVFGRKGAIDRNAIVNESQDGWFLGSDGIRLRLSGDHNSLYFSYLLRSRSIGQWLMQNSQGAIMPTLNQSILDRLPISIPELKTQEKIAAVLSSLDAKIELNQRMNAELEGMAKLLYDYWFVQHDFPLSAAQAAALGRPALTGHPYRTSGAPMTYHPQLKREIPKGWKVENILAAAELGGGATPSKKNANYWNGEIPFFTPTDATSEAFCLDTADHITEEGLSNISTRLFSEGTLFITARGSVGKAMIISREMAMNQSCYALIPREGIGRAFLYYQTLSLMGFLHAKSSGSVFKSIVTNDLKFTPAIVPSPEIIDEFNKFAEPIFEQILINQKQNQELSRLRDWLLPMLMNGQVRVGDS